MGLVIKQGHGAKKWDIIDLEIPVSLFSKRFSFRKFYNRPWTFHWFFKPFLLLQSPYRRTIWIDIDCLVRGSIADLFDFADNPHGISLSVDKRPEKIKAKINSGILKPHHKHYTSGVLPYLHGNEIVKKWAWGVLELEGNFTGDQDVLNHIIGEENIEVPIFPSKYHYIVPRNEPVIDPEALIIHFGGSSKRFIMDLVTRYSKLM